MNLITSNHLGAQRKQLHDYLQYVFDILGGGKRICTPNLSSNAIVKLSLEPLNSSKCTWMIGSSGPPVWHSL
jgi:hypothetical protein